MSDEITVKEVEITKKKSSEDIEMENQKLAKALAENDKENNSKKIDTNRLAALKAKMAQKEKEEKKMLEIVNKNKFSIKMGIIGVGQAGSRIAEQFHKLGYDACVINTSSQDLEFIDVLPSQKLLLEGTLGGTGKSLDLGREIFANSVDKITEFINDNVSGNSMLFLTISGGGGSGASSVDTMIPLLFGMEVPVGVIFVLPKQTEDAISKANSVETLSRLSAMAAENLISCLIVVDNARIEQIYGGLSQSQFWTTANKAIVEPFNIFNTLTALPSKFTSLDPSDFGKIISTGDCSIFGMIEVKNFMEETALAESVIQSLDESMLASGFDLTQTRNAGVIIVGSENVLKQLPALNIDYCFSMISEKTGGAGIFQGIYSQDNIGEDVVKIYSWFSGLGLPKDRIENLRKESKLQAGILADKEKQRVSQMKLDLEENKINSTKELIERKIQQKKSGFNKLQGLSKDSVVDRRKK